LVGKGAAIPNVIWGWRCTKIGGNRPRERRRDEGTGPGKGEYPSTRNIHGVEVTDGEMVTLKIIGLLMLVLYSDRECNPQFFLPRLREAYQLYETLSR
jgi:hypothetical protein